MFGLECNCPVWVTPIPCLVRVTSRTLQNKIKFIQLRRSVTAHVLTLIRTDSNTGVGTNTQIHTNTPALLELLFRLLRTPCCILGLELWAMSWEQAPPATQTK